MNEWMYSILRLSLIVLSLFSGHVQATSVLDVMSSDEIIASTPRLTLDDKDISSYGLRLKLTASNGTRLDLLLFEARSRKSGLILFDPSDGTPMVVVVGDEMLYYEPLQGVVVVTRGYYSLQLSGEKLDDGLSKLNLEFGIFGGERESDGAAPHQNLIDVRSVISGFEASEVASREVETDKYVVIGTNEGGSQMKALFERREGRNLFKWLALLPPGDEGVNVLFQLVDFNTPIAMKWFKLPGDVLADAGLRVVNKRADANTKPISLNTFIAAMMLRMVPAMADDLPEKKKVESYLELPKDFDWGRLQKIDRAISQTLRRVYADGKLLDSLSAP